RERLPGGSAPIAALISALDDQTLIEAIRNLGGHDLAALDQAYASIDDTRPTVIFAYTIKGYGLPTQGHPQNHSALLTTEQMRALASQLGTDLDRPWSRFAPATDAGQLCAATAQRLQRPAYPAHPALVIPADIGRTPSGTASTQAALGRVLLD